MDSGWPTKPVSETATLYDSLHKTPKYSDTGYPMIRVTDIRRGFVDTKDAKRVDRDTYLEFSKKHPPEIGDILFSRVGSYGNSSYVNHREEFCLGQNTVCIAPNRKRIDPLFFYLCLNSDFVRDQIDALVGGASQPTISLENIKTLRLPDPPLAVQYSIAGILSAYDELIENCQRRVRILEKMARALYREWFVRFRFPGHEKIPQVDSPLGPTPKGWEVKKLADVAEVNRAQINVRNAPDELHYIDISSVSPGQIDSITTYAFAEAPGRARRIVQHGDVLWSCVRPNRRSHAQVMHPAPNTIASTGFALLTATKVPFTFLYFATTTDDFVAFLANNATGAAYPAVTAPTFEKAELLIPPAALLKRFGDATIPMAEEVHILQRKIQNLRRTRDLLLPRLLSGKVFLDVSIVEDVAKPTVPAPPSRSQVQLGNEDFASKEPTLRAAEEAPPWRVARAARGLPFPAAPAEEAPVPIDQIDRTEVLQVIRQVFSEGPPRERDAAIRDVARALGYRRTGPRIQDILHTDLMTAVRRCILENESGALRLCARSITDYDRDFLKQQFLASIGRTWIDRDTATRDFCRWLGFARTGPIIEDTARSLINGLLREHRLEADADLIRRKA